MTFDALDRDRMARAIDLAVGSIGLSDPNPRVGCVIADADGSVVAEGFTQKAGGPHAEAVSLALARSRQADLSGGTAWVTLEPCAHHGRTPPCADALVAAGLSRVVVAIGDPFAQVAGAGLQRLRGAGMTVDLLDADDELAQAAREINIGFFSRIERQRPWVRMKLAMSLDGRAALPNGVSQWITGEQARSDGHHWRKRASAILTGIGTVLDDDPRLDVRLVTTDLQPLRVVVDSALRIPGPARILQPPGRCLVVAAAESDARGDELRALGADLLTLPGADGRVDLTALLKYLADIEVNELHVEAGGRLNGALLGAGLVDELLVYLAPRLIGPGRAIADLPALDSLGGTIAFTIYDMRQLGDDLRLLLRRFPLQNYAP